MVRQAPNLAEPYGTLAALFEVGRRGAGQNQRVAARRAVAAGRSAACGSCRGARSRRPSSTPFSFWRPTPRPVPHPTRQVIGEKRRALDYLMISLHMTPKVSLLVAHLLPGRRVPCARCASAPAQRPGADFILQTRRPLLSALTYAV